MRMRGRMGRMGREGRRVLAKDEEDMGSDFCLAAFKYNMVLKSVLSILSYL